MRSLLLITLLLLSNPLASGQDATMEIGDWVGEVDETITVDVVYDPDDISTKAFVVVVCHDSDLAMVTDVYFPAYLEDFSDGLVSIEDGLCRVAFIPLVDEVESSVVEDNDGLIVHIDYSLASPGVTDLTFCVEVNGTLENETMAVYVNDDDELVELDLELTDGTLTILAPFLRGDVDNDGSVSALIDGLALLESYFASGPALECLDSADVDDSGNVSPLLDALYLLNYAFNDGEAPPAPTDDECDTDPTDDDIGCDVVSSTCE